ncbi:MAG: methyltransferase domain-containing protein [Acidobacteria bacterium]|nr:methyltransferase domain-containing protein [Acidobacteriota bacterium]
MMDRIWSLALESAERGIAPDAAIRFGIRRLCGQRLGEERARGVSPAAFAERMRRGPVAPVPEKANEQHYEAPPELFRLALGPRLKYSCCLWGDGVETLARAEEAALEETCRRAELRDGHSILELGCGWGSLSLWMAERYPGSRITAVSNSRLQRRFIEERAVERGLENLRVVTADMNDFETDDRFDRVVSVEMFEHMRNYEELLRRIAGWLRPDGKLFVHIFCHRRYGYAFETTGATEWLGRNFFTGGIMPSADVFTYFQREMRLTRQWTWDGTHYQRTAEAWLANLDERKGEVLPVLAATYGAREAERTFQRWRIFFMACAELWGYAAGNEWLVGHYLLERVAGGGEGARAAESDCVDCR